MIVIDPITVDGDGLTRASTATYTNRAGEMAMAAIDEMRISYDAADLTAPPVALVETSPATNVLRNSGIGGGDLPTQTLTVTAVVHTLSFYGAGTVVMSGAAIGLLAGTGPYPARSTITITPTAGSLTLTVSGRVQFAQLETGPRATSFIPTAGAAVTRAADTIGLGTLLYSNVPENEYPTHDMGVAYAIDARVIHDHRIYQAVAAGTGHPVNDPAWWVLFGPTNQRKMFDAVNNTATQNTDVIRVAIRPLSVVGGLYLGGVVGSNVRVTLADSRGARVYSATESLLRQTVGVSYFAWMFSRIYRDTATIKLDIPPYYDGVFLVEILNPGGVASVSMLALGPTENIGLTNYGVSRDIEDYSTDVFDVDGSSTTTLRGYSKGMELTVTVDNQDIDTVVDTVENYRQRAVVWVAEQEMRHTVVYGKYQNFKTAIVNYPDSTMTLTIKGKI